MLHCPKICSETCSCTNDKSFIFMSLFTCTYVCIYAHMYAYIYTCLCTYMYIFGKCLQSFTKICILLYYMFYRVKDIDLFKIYAKRK